MTTVGDLIERLSEFDEDMEVAVAFQPSYPLTGVLSAVTGPEDVAGSEQCDEHGLYDCVDCMSSSPRVVWLAVRQEDVNGTPYAPHAAWDGSL